MKVLTVVWQGPVIKFVNGLKDDKDFVAFYVNQEMSVSEQEETRKICELQQKYFSVVFLVDIDEMTILDTWMNEEYELVHEYRERDLAEYENFDVDNFIREVES